MPGGWCRGWRRPFGSLTLFPGLKTSLAINAETGAVTYTLQNATDSTLPEAVLTIALPPGLEPGLIRRKHGELGPNQVWCVTAPVTAKRTDGYWKDGSGYYAAQLDFVLDGKRGRLFATNSVAAELAAR